MPTSSVLTLANGLPPSGERRLLSNSFMHSLFCSPSQPKLLKCLRFCSTARLAAGAKQRIQGQHFLFLFWQTRSGTSLSTPVPTAEKHKETKEGRFSRKARTVGHKVGLSFQLLLWQKESSPHPRPHLFRAGGKEYRVRASFVLLRFLAEVPGAGTGFPESDHHFLFTATDPDSYCLSLLPTLSLETDEREGCTGHWKEIDALDFRACRKQRFLPDRTSAEGLCVPLSLP